MQTIWWWGSGFKGGWTWDFKSCQALVVKMGFMKEKELSKIRAGVLVTLCNPNWEAILSVSVTDIKKSRK